jgi:hypothetical protein
MKRMIVMGLGLAAIAAGVWLCGCETESATENNLVVTPRTAVLRPGESVTLTAQNGFDYKWSLTGDTTRGYLSAIAGPVTTYTSTSDPLKETAQQVITLTSYINRQATNSPTGDYEQTAQAVITHIGQLLIDPSSVNLKQWESQDFQAWGGRGGYAWTVGDSGLGLLTGSSGNKVTYTATHDPGPSNTVYQTIICRSLDDGVIVRAAVSQVQTTY